MMCLKENSFVLDIGCGPGIDTTSLSKRIGTGGGVFGIDNDFQMLREVEKKKKIGKSEFINLFNIHSDAQDLPFRDKAFDAARSERVFQHVINPKKVLMEMTRVVKKGGRLVVVETDWSTLTIDTDEFDIEQRIKNHCITKIIQSGLAARQLFRLFTEFRLSDITVDVFPMHINDIAIAKRSLNLQEAETEALQSGSITKNELKKWQKSLNRDNIFFGSINIIQVSATNIQHSE